jgi:hypothetical protein
MRKFKSFSVGFSDESDELDTKVNKWLEEHKHIRILETKLATCTGENALGNVFVNATLIVWYEPFTMSDLESLAGV